jgi:hypothetical protein
LTEANISGLHDNPLNSSSSKMQYSIPKSKRWSEDKLASYIFVHYSKDFKNPSFMICLT